MKTKPRGSSKIQKFRKSTVEKAEIPVEKMVPTEQPARTADHEITGPELHAVLMACRLTEAMDPPVTLDEKLSNPDFQNNLRAGLEKLLAKCEMRTPFSDPRLHVQYLRDRISSGRAWLRIALTHRIWGSVEDAYSALNGRSPSVKTWRTDGFVGTPWERNAGVDTTFLAVRRPDPIRPLPGTVALACGKCSACVAFRCEEPGNPNQLPKAHPCLNPTFVEKKGKGFARRVTAAILKINGGPR